MAELTARERILRALNQQDDLARFKQEAQEARAFVEEHGVLLAGGWGVRMEWPR